MGGVLLCEHPSLGQMRLCESIFPLVQAFAENRKFEAHFKMAAFPSPAGITGGSWRQHSPKWGGLCGLSSQAGTLSLQRSVSCCVSAPACHRPRSFMVPVSRDSASDHLPLRLLPCDHASLKGLRETLVFNLFSFAFLL